MAYVNVKDWSVDQVTDWLKGLDNVILQYNSSFLNNGVTGHQLLNLRADDLEHLGVKMLGHQEIILEAVEHLRNFHFELDKENLQTLALKLSCAANSLYKELMLVDDECSLIQTQVMSDVHNIITTIKPLVYWLDRSPFAGDKDYFENKMMLLQLGFEMATSAHRGIFSEKPVCIIRKNCEELTKIADHIIQEVMDPMILQPACLDLATLKKKEQELGFFILPNNHAIHQIGDIKHGSPAHGSPKIEEGDEIVQVNYQTVVGWQRKKVVMLLQDSPPEIVLTLKKRPRHTKVYGQIYMKPYRLPSRKRNGPNWTTRWNDSIPSPRLLPIIDLPPITIPKISDPADIPDVETELNSSDSEPPDSPLDVNYRMYPLKPRPILQRRNTITGATPTNKRPYPSIEQYWEFMKFRKNASSHLSSYEIDSTKFEEDSKFLRDKSASCNVGLDLSPRPTTVLGITHSNSSAQKKNVKDRGVKKKVNFQEECDPIIGKNDKDKSVKLEISNLDEEKSVSIISLTSLNNENITYIDEGRELTDRTSMAQDWKKEIVEEIIDTIKMKAIVEEKPPKLEEKPPKLEEKTPKLEEKSSLIAKESALPQEKSDKSNAAVIKDPILSEINVHNIIKKFDEQKQEAIVKPRVLPRVTLKKPPEVPVKPEGKVKPAVPPRSATTKLRGKLDKSHSTPAYDLTEELGENVESLPVVTPLPEKPKETPREPEVTVQLEVESEPRVPAVEELHVVKKLEIVKAEEPTPEAHIIEVPPKPPPRNVLDIPKPVYPVDSPKPALVEMPKVARLEIVASKPVFDFSDTKLSDTIPVETLAPEPILKNVPDDILTPRYFEPKMVSTPVTKCKMDFEVDLTPKQFEPKPVPTPVAKSKIDLEAEVVVHKAVPSYEIQKGVNETKVSPTNSIVKAMISSKCKAKKKNMLTAKRRKVTVSDLSPADIQGYLYQRLRGKHNQNVHWEKRWFVLLGNCLYGFRTKECPRAACLIFLSGFTVAVASEVKSRSNAFKVYHTGTVFYFSADDPDALQSWIDLIRTATLHNETHKSQETSLYSETDESDTEKPKHEEKSDSLKKFGSLKKFTSKKSTSEAPPSGSTSLDRKWFFNKSHNQPKHSLPVPTAQFRSYRKIRTTEVESSITTGNFTSHVPMFTPHSQNVSVPNLTVEAVAKPDQSQQFAKSKPKPINYVHASNPSLGNLADFSVPGFNKNQFNKTGAENLTGFVTLEELMIKQTEERKMNPHHIVEEVTKKLQLVQPEVVYGEVPIRPKDCESEINSKPPSSGKTRVSAATEKQDTSGSSCFGKRLGSLKKNQKSDDFENNKTATYPKASKGYGQKVNRSLPRTHKIQEVYLEAVPIAQPAYTSEGNVSVPNKERSYEMIYCPETVNDVQFATNRALDDTMYQDTPKKGHKIKKQHSFSSSSSDKKSKGTNKVQDSSSTKVKLKSAVQYTPMMLPVSQDPKSKPKFLFEINLDDKSQKSGKLKQMFGGKSESKKEKTFLGSPKLHRAIFKKHGSGSDLSWPSSASSTPQISMSQSSYSLENSPPVITEPFSMNISPHTDYPGLEYPPVFEAETYSLANPQSNLSILRKQGKNETP